jgi:hypothetical protein
MEKSMLFEKITRRCLLTLEGGGKDSSRPHYAETDKTHLSKGNGTSVY